MLGMPDVTTQKLRKMSLEAISEGEGKGRRSVPVRARGRKAPDGARVLLLLLIVVVLTGELPVVLPTESALIIGDLYCPIL